MKLILTTIFLVLILSACQPAGVTLQPGPAVDGPAVEISTPTTFVPEVKEVEMVTQTPAVPTARPDAGLPTADPNQPTPTSTPVGLPKTLEELGVPATTYQDTVTGLAFEYPASWIINPMSDEDKKTAVVYSVSLRSKIVQRGPKQQEGVPPDMAAIDVTVIKNGPKTYEQAVIERRASATNSESGRPVIIAQEEEWTLTGGLPAHRFLFNLGKDPVNDPNAPDRMASELVTMINGQMILVSGMGDQSLFDVIAGSLRAIQ
jgi:hypothetical protein